MTASRCRHELGLTFPIEGGTLTRDFIAFASVCAAILISGCAASSPIQQYNRSESSFNDEPKLISHNHPEKDVYRIYHRAASGFVSIQSIRGSAEARAEQFASQRGKTLVILGERTSSAPYILGNFPRIEIIFALVDKPNHASVASEHDKIGSLERLKKLFDDGTLTQQEFEREKAKILTRDE